ncbi:SDR family oxidoreductase [Kaistia dalseonensis]|uniref:NAD(P)-dependent dehydrogenase (Short-subunit alcohol dehydrogenase family) n=1 Tax=Kaistia dalseonensis TaxID=410840 RepID=A0ABU0H8Y6_9HYPH|nr:SDR family oxidoreductase [Kaistia dalseonensis]MCX5495731.1 SDR family oxidoreductase [Kaistia dalseonensis]MDQ0438328.1 NAD(P)-dependent dehydrogenase (short-subunit alcohol dehydrogenase family) [Kaistia dalseonensis]
MRNISEARPLRGKVALVTGGARGLGLETSRQLARKGAHVMIAARDISRAEAAAESLLSEGLHVSTLRLEVTSVADHQTAYAAIERLHERLDILVNNAGILVDGGAGALAPDQPPSDAHPRTVRDIVDVNFFAPVLLTQTLLPLIKRSEAGRIVNVSSIRGSLSHMSDASSPIYRNRTLGYNASKAALNAFTILLAEELRDTAIKVNAIHPGWLRTDMGGKEADMSVEEGAEIAVHYASLPEDGPSGGFFFGEDRLPW